jgi:hypothetical protein
MPVESAARIASVSDPYCRYWRWSRRTKACRGVSGGCRKIASTTSFASRNRSSFVLLPYLICDLDLAAIGRGAKCPGQIPRAAHAAFLAVRVLAGFRERNSLECRPATARADFFNLCFLTSFSLPRFLSKVHSKGSRAFVPRPAKGQGLERRPIAWRAAIPMGLSERN